MSLARRALHVLGVHDFVVQFSLLFEVEFALCAPIVFVFLHDREIYSGYLVFFFFDGSIFGLEFRVQALV